MIPTIIKITPIIFFKMSIIFLYMNLSIYADFWNGFFFNQSASYASSYGKWLVADYAAQNIL